MCQTVILRLYICQTLILKFCMCQTLVLRLRFCQILVTVLQNQFDRYNVTVFIEQPVTVTSLILPV